MCLGIKNEAIEASEQDVLNSIITDVEKIALGIDYRLFGLGFCLWETVCFLPVPALP
jgi:hypothetical protein